MSSFWMRCAGTALAVAVGGSVASAVAGAQTAPITLSVDLTDAPRKILHATGVPLSEVADSRRAFNQIDSEKLKRRAEALLRSGATSPSRGFKGDWTSAGS